MYKSKNPELSRKLLCTISRMTNNVVVVLPPNRIAEEQHFRSLGETLELLTRPSAPRVDEIYLCLWQPPSRPDPRWLRHSWTSALRCFPEPMARIPVTHPEFFPDGDLRTRRGGRGIFRRRTRTHRRARYQLVVCGWQRPDHYHRPRCASRGVRRGDLHAGIPRHR